MQFWGEKYPNAGYGYWFRCWLMDWNPKPLNSFGNGSAMRVSSIAEAFYGVPEELKKECLGRLPDDLKAILLRFDNVLEEKQGKREKNHCE